MTRTWRNEWRVYSGMRTAGRWAVWAAVAFVSLHVVATVVQRMAQ